MPPRAEVRWKGLAEPSLIELLPSLQNGARVLSSSTAAEIKAQEAGTDTGHCSQERNHMTGLEQHGVTCVSLGACLWALVSYRDFLSLKTLMCRVEVTLACRAAVRNR